MRQKHACGLTLLDLLITLCIISFLFLLCQTNLGTLFGSTTAQVDAERFFHTLNFARSVAIKNNQRVFVCPTDTDWSQGYMVFYHPRHDQTRRKVLRVEKNNALTHIDSKNTPFIQFTGDGRSLHRATFHIQANTSFKIVIYDSGRIRIAHLQ